MKNLIIPIIILGLVSFTLPKTELTDAERLLAMTELTVSHDSLIQSLNGLSEAQINFKISPDSWSIAECTEHIAISETIIFGMLEAALKTPANPARHSEVKLADDQILSIVEDRTNKVKTSEPFEPTGKFGSQDAALKDFKTNRIEHIKYISTTQDHLRDYYTETPLGLMDAFQVLLFISAHSERHISQIEEIKVNENFPKK